MTVADVTHRLAALNTFLGIENEDDKDKIIDIEEYSYNPKPKFAKENKKHEI